MARTIKIKKPASPDLDRKGLLIIYNSYNIKRVMLDMFSTGDLDGWDDIDEEGNLIMAMEAETDLKRKAVYCMVLGNFEDEI